MKNLRLIPRALLLAVALAPAAADAARDPFKDLLNPRLEPFYHGVASGDPLSDGVIIWTRVTPRGNDQKAKIPVRWTVAEDRALNRVVAQGVELARAGRDHTVKVDVRGLQPGTTYFYGFRAYGSDSLVGRTRTAPADAVDELKFAVVSCANMDWGYFGGYRRISMRGDLDAVVCVGDYLYEYPDNASYSSPRVRDERLILPRGETVKLGHYRKRYATYRLDPDLRRAHKQHPFIAIWDDHEFANNAWRGGAENHQPRSEGPWRDRKTAARRAFLEWMPVREQGLRIYRHLEYGPLMDLILIDTRIQGRDKQIDDVTNRRLYDRDRTMLGERQKEWLKQKLAGSNARWKVIGNQVLFSEFNIGFAAKGDVLITHAMLESQFLDIWDGYPAERREIVRFLQRRNIENTVILTGDIHCSFAFEVADPAAGNPNYNPRTGEGAAAVEFVTPSLSAANFDEEIGDFLTESVEGAINKGGRNNPNPHMKFADLDRHGYFVLTVRPARVQADYYYLHNVLRRFTKEEWGGGWMCRSGTNHLVKARRPAEPKAVPEPLAPSNAAEDADDEGAE